jgi:hypothetical protein
VNGAGAPQGGKIEGETRIVRERTASIERNRRQKNWLERLLDVNEKSKS